MLEKCNLRPYHYLDETPAKFTHLFIEGYHGKRKTMIKSLPDHNIWFNLLIFSMIVLVAACGGSSPSTGSTATPTTVASTPTNVAGETPIASITSTPPGQTPTATSTPTPRPPTPTPTPRPTPTPTPRPTPTPVPHQTVTVQIVGTNTFSFSPASITITPGTIVKWINHTQAPHTVTGGSFGSAIISPGGTYTFTFNSGGRFAYHCSIHPYMTGTINVT